MSRTAIERHRWAREEYDRMIAAGVFHPEARLELIDGEIVNMTPQGSLHATAVRLAEDLLRVAFSTGFDIRVQMPLALDDSSEPEPDLAVVTGSPREYRDAHPSGAVLIVEVADATLSFDRQQKKTLYARTGIQEYWIVNLTDEQLEVYRDPRGTDYTRKTTLRSGQSVAPLAAPESSISVIELLP
ncbi:MAG: Uma2 family endonuclease [Acidiferrobacterales bacterium]